MGTKQLWKDKGYAGSQFNVALPFFNSGHKHLIVNTETGEQKTIHVRSDQTLNEAISNGQQWTQDIAIAEDDEIDELYTLKIDFKVFAGSEQIYDEQIRN